LCLLRDNNDKPNLITNVDVLWMGFSLLSSVSKHNMWWYYGWFCSCFLQSVNTPCGRNQVGFVVFVVCHYTKYVDVLWLGLSLLSSVNKHNVCSYYDWAYCCCRPSVNTICGDNNDKPNLITITYYVYGQMKTKTNPTIMRPHIVFTDGRQQQQTQP
jgi:hypothetical protein